MSCKHPPSRLYSWRVNDAYDKERLIVACCECGKILKGGETQQELEARLAKEVQAGKVKFYIAGRPIKK